MIPLEALLDTRHDLSLVQYKHRCLALLLLDNASDASLITEAIALVNRFSPQRVQLTHSSHTLPFADLLVVEMPYCSNIQQTYFTYLVWTWSRRVPAWMHVWDTIHHDALRRDFPVPTYMDSELAANRMFLRHGEAFLVNTGYSPDNPHGELVAELGLEAAAHALSAGCFEPATVTSDAIAVVFSEPDADSHFLSHVSDVHVSLPRGCTQILADHPYLLTWSRDLDLRRINLSAIAADLRSENQSSYKVAIPNAPTCPKTVPGGLPAGQYASICILSNLVAEFGADFARGETDISALSSAYLMQQLRAHGLSNSRQVASEVSEAACASVQDWAQPVSFIESELDDSEKAPETLDHMLKGIEAQLDAEMAVEDGAMDAALHAKDVDMDDFVEFYARRYLHMTDEQLAQHRAVPKEPDWSAYNDDSDYSD